MNNILIYVLVDGEVKVFAENKELIIIDDYYFRDGVKIGKVVKTKSLIPQITYFCEYEQGKYTVQKEEEINYDKAITVWKLTENSFICIYNKY